MYTLCVQGANGPPLRPQGSDALSISMICMFIIIVFIIISSSIITSSIHTISTLA